MAIQKHNYYWGLYMRLVPVENHEIFACQKNGTNWQRKMVMREPPSRYKNTKLRVIDKVTIVKEEHANDTVRHHLAETGT